MKDKRYYVARVDHAGCEVNEYVRVCWDSLDGQYYAVALATMGCGKHRATPEAAIQQLCNDHGIYLFSTPEE